MNIETLTKLEQQFHEFPVVRAVEADVREEEIEDAERAVGFTFHPDYRLFLQKFGGAMVGAYPIFGLRQAEVMGDDMWSVVEMTRHFRAQRWPGADSSYIISMDGFGNPIGIFSDGTVRMYDHDSRESITLSTGFEEFLLKICLK